MIFSEISDSQPPHLLLKALCVLLEKKSSSVLVPHRRATEGQNLSGQLSDLESLESSET